MVRFLRIYEGVFLFLTSLVVVVASYQKEYRSFFEVISIVAMTCLLVAIASRRNVIRKCYVIVFGAVGLFLMGVKLSALVFVVAAFVIPRLILNDMRRAPWVSLPMSGFNRNEPITVNPATGLPMLGVSGVDAGGNPIGRRL